MIFITFMGLQGLCSLKISVNVPLGCTQQSRALNLILLYFFPVIMFHIKQFEAGNKKKKNRFANAEVDVNDRVMDTADGILLFTYYRA